MAEIVTAIHEKGVLRPLHPLDLQEHQTVQLQVLPQVSTEDETETALRKLIEAGILTPPPGHSDVVPMSEKERRDLADRLGRASGKPLSEIIIEDRGQSPLIPRP